MPSSAIDWILDDEANKTIRHKSSRDFAVERSKFFMDWSSAIGFSQSLSIAWVLRKMITATGALPSFDRFACGFSQA